MDLDESELEGFDDVLDKMQEGILCILMDIQIYGMM